MDKTHIRYGFRFNLRKNIFNTIAFATLYNECLTSSCKEHKSNSVYKECYIMNSCKMHIIQSNYDRYIQMLNCIFPHSYAFLQNDAVYYILIPFTWRFFILCNPMNSRVLVGSSTDIINYLYNIYQHRHILITHMG